MTIAATNRWSCILVLPIVLDARVPAVQVGCPCIGGSAADLQPARSVGEMNVGDLQQGLRGRANGRGE
jgi:hypothetical protein